MKSFNGSSSKTLSSSFNRISYQKCKISHLVILFILFFFSHSPATAPDTLWTKTFGGDSSETGYSVRQTSDGGFIIAGETKSFGAGNADVYLIRTNAYSFRILFPIQV